LPLGWNPPISRSASRSESWPRPPLLAAPAASFRFLRLCLHPFPLPSFLPSLRTSSSFHSSGRPGVDRPSSLHLRIIGGCTTSPPHHWRLHHFTSASLEAAPLHLRIMGGCITSPPHHGRLHHFTSASLEAAPLHLRIMGGCITSPPHHGRLHHFTSASLEAASSAPQSIIWGIIFRLLRRSDLSKLRQSVLIGERAYQSNHSISHEWAYQSDHSTSLLQHADRVLAAPIGPPLFPAAGPAGAAATLLAPSAPSSVNGRSPAPPTRRALEASSVHLRILGCLVRPPPHHWRLPRSTPASLWLRHPPCDRSLGPRPLLAPSARPDRLHQSVLVIGRNVSG